MSADQSREHPGIDAILAYLEAPGAPGQAALRLHLAQCPACRREAAGAALLRAQAPWIESPAREPDPRLAALLDGDLDAESARALEAELDADPEARRAALHYASHALAMRGSSAEAAPRRAVASGPRVSFPRWWRAGVPAWQAAAAVAFTLVLAVWLAPAPVGDDEWRVIAFDQPGELRFVGREAQPGIGFFSTGGARQPWDGVRVEIAGERRLRLRWPAIDGANGYNLRLKVFRDGEARELARRQLETNEVELELEQWLPRHRYEWQVSGDTARRGAFVASGEFIIDRETATP